MDLFSAALASEYVPMMDMLLFGFLCCCLLFVVLFVVYITD